MSTLGALKSRIASELIRSDQTANIANAISRAIEHYAGQRFWFNQSRGTATTTPSDEYVANPSGLRIEDSVFVTVGGSQYRLCKQSADAIEDLQGLVTTEGQPTDYASIGDQVRLYPTPNQAYPMAFVGVFDLTALESDDDSNAWTDEAQDLIAARARYTILRDILRDPEQAMAAQVAEREALARLRAESTRRVGTGRITPSW